MIKLEKNLEKKITTKAIKLGFMVKKFEAEKGDPDRIFFSKHICPHCKSGKVFFIEFKSAKGKLTKLQQKKISELVEYNQNVFVVNNEELGLEILTEFIDDA